MTCGEIKKRRRRTMGMQEVKKRILREPKDTLDEGDSQVADNPNRENTEKSE
jgi:hypothetical protein